MKTVRGLIALLALLWTAPAFAGGPFDGLGVDWKGSGYITPVNKPKEPTTCTRKGSVSNGGHNLSFNFSCKSASVTFDVFFNFASKNGEVTGRGTAKGWPVRITGGRVRNGVIHASYETPRSSGTLTIRKRTVRQSSPNAVEVSNLVVAAN